MRIPGRWETGDELEGEGQAGLCIWMALCLAGWIETTLLCMSTLTCCVAFGDVSSDDGKMLYTWAVYQFIVLYFGGPVLHGNTGSRPLVVDAHQGRPWASSDLIRSTFYGATNKSQTGLSERARSGRRYGRGQHVTVCWSEEGHEVDQSVMISTLPAPCAGVRAQPG